LRGRASLLLPDPYISPLKDAFRISHVRSNI
jgi:hypothetical protein